MTKKGYKECPVCAEWIREKANVCRFCGAVFVTESLPVTAPSKAHPAGPPLSDQLEKRFGDLGISLSWPHRHRLENFLQSAEEEYRTAAVMFVDITGYTALSQQLRAEYIKDILDVYYNLCTQVIDFFNGFVLKFEGDGCLAVFGAPVAYDRDVESAVRAALEIRKRIKVFPRIHDAKISVSIGIATGEILSSITHTHTARHYDIFGQAVNLASRIQSAARANVILIDPDTHELVEELFDVRKKAPKKLKNIDQPVVTYEVIAPKAAKVIHSDLTIPFVGRRRELDHLEDVWSQFREKIASGQPSTRNHNGLILSGEPGVGKTRLVTEFSNRHEPHARVIYVEGVPYGVNTPWGLWRSVMESILKVNPGDPEEAVRRAIKRLLSEIKLESDEVNTFLALFGFKDAVDAMSTLPPEKVKRLFCADLSSVLERLADDKPLLLVLDDLQWGDSTSLEALNELVAMPSLYRVFFLLSHRTSYVLKGTGVKALTHISLHGLDEQSSHALFNILADAREFMPEIRDALLHHTANNPFYMIELIRSATQSLKKIKGKVEKESLAQQLSEQIPLSLKDMLQSHIDLLDQRRKLVLQCASVLGKQFAFQIIQLFEMIREGLLARLYSLKSIEFLDDEVTSGGLEFLFRHHITREVAYQSLLERKRRELHQVVADQIEKKFPERLEELSTLLAYHYSQSDSYEKATEYLQRAGDHATKLGAVREAIEHHTRALQSLKRCKTTRKNRQRRVAILRSLGRMHRIAGENEIAMESFRNALSIVRKLKRRKETAMLHTEIGLTHIQTGEYDAAEKELSKALENIKGRRELELRAMILNGLGICSWGRGDFKNARTSFEKINKTALEKTNPNLAADVCNNLALLDWKAGRLAESSRMFNTALRFRHRAHDKFGVALTLMNLGITEENRGHYKTAEGHYYKALTLAEQLHFSQVITAVYANLANLFLVQGRNREALDYSAHSFEIAERIGDRRSAAIALENLALSHLALRQFEEARKQLRRARKLAREIEDNERLLSLDLVEIELLLEEDKTDRIGSKLKNAQKTIDEHSYDSELPRLLRLSALAHFKTGKLKEAGEAATRALKESRDQSNRTEEDRLKELLEEINRK